MAAAFGVVLLLLTGGCRTTVGLEVMKPSEIDMSEYSQLAVFEIEPYELSVEDFAGSVIFQLLLGESILQPTGYTLLLTDEIANQLERSILQSLQMADYFTLIGPSQLRPFKGSKKDGAYPNAVLTSELNVTAALVGSVDYLWFDEDTIETTVEQTDDLGNVVQVVEKRFRQVARIDFSYSIVDLRTNDIVGSKYFSKSNSRTTFISDEYDFRPPSLSSLYRPLITSIANEIRSQLAPRMVREYRFMEKDKSGSVEMKRADYAVKDGEYRTALNLYLSIWKETGNYAAGYNAAILYEVIGQLEKAIAQMGEVAKNTGTLKAYQKVDELKRSLDEYHEVTSQLRD